MIPGTLAWVWTECPCFDVPGDVTDFKTVRFLKRDELCLVIASIKSERTEENRARYAKTQKTMEEVLVVCNDTLGWVNVNNLRTHLTPK